MALSRNLQGLQGEIVTLKNDILYPVYGGQLLYPRDETLIERGSRNWRAYEIYSDILKDCHAYAVYQKRVNAVVAREWSVVPASEDAQDKKAADMVRAHLDQLGNRNDPEEDGETIITPASGFDRACADLLSATHYGFSVSEPIWDTDGKEIYPTEVRSRDIRRFAFLVGDRGAKLRLLTPDAILDGIPLPAKKAIVHRYVSVPTEDPYGLGNGTRLFYPTYFKRNAAKFWLIFADKWASPTAVAKHPANASKQLKDSLLELLQAISTDSGVTIPEGVTLDFLEAQRYGTVNTYESLIDFCNGEISKATIGETGTTDQSDGGGSRARDQVGNEVRIEIAKGDADLLSETLNRTLCRWITQLNIPDARPPRVWRRFPELEKQEDLDKRVAREKTLYDMGFFLTRDYVIRTYEVELQEEVVEPAQPELPEIPQFAEPGELGEPGPDPADRYAEQVGDRINSITSDWMAQVQQVVEGASSFAEVRDRLSDLYPDLPAADFVAVMGQAMAASDLAGRQQVREESGLDAPELSEPADFAIARQRICTKGWSCGRSCISRGKVCRKALEGQAKTYTEWLSKQVQAQAPTPTRRRSTELPSGVSRIPVGIGDVAYVFSVGGKDIFLSVTRGEVIFSVDGQLAMSTLSKADRRKAAVKLVRIMKYDASGRPDGFQYACSASLSSGKGAYRSTAYIKQGFSRPVGGNAGSKQYAIVRNGRATPDNKRLREYEERLIAQLPSGSRRMYFDNVRNNLKTILRERREQ